MGISRKRVVGWAKAAGIPLFFTLLAACAVYVSFCLGYGIAFHGWPLTSTASELGKLGDWVGALGGFAAAVAAVWLGSRDVRRRNREADEARQVMEGFIRPECIALLQRMRILLFILDSPNVNAKLGTLDGAIEMEGARMIAIAPALTLVTSHLERLPYLGVHKAAALGRAVGTLPILRDALLSAAQDPSAGNTKIKHIQDAVLFARDQVLTIKESVELAVGMDAGLQLKITLDGYYGAMEVSPRMRHLLDQRERSGATMEAGDGT